MKKKFFLSILATITSVFFIIGCSNTSNVSGGQDEMMARVEHHRDYDIWVDKDTGVMFLCIDHQNGVGVTVMPNADGTPKIWQGDIKEYEPDFSE